MVTHNALNISSSWSIQDHWDFMSKTPEFKEIVLKESIK